MGPGKPVKSFNLDWVFWRQGTFKIGAQPVLEQHLIHASLDHMVDPLVTKVRAKKPPPMKDHSVDAGGP